MKHEIPTAARKEQKSIFVAIPTHGIGAREKCDLIKATLSRQGWRPVTPYEVFTGNGDPLQAQVREALKCNAILFCDELRLVDEGLYHSLTDAVRSYNTHNAEEGIIKIYFSEQRARP